MFINYSLITFAQRSTILQLVCVRACVRARARVEANCVTGYVSLAKLDCLKSSKRESTPCRLYVSASDPASNNFFSSFCAIFCFPFSFSSSCFLLLRARIARILARKLHRKFCLRAACLLARDSSNQWIFSEKYSHAVPIKGFPTGVTNVSAFLHCVSCAERMRSREHDFYSQRVVRLRE